MPPLLGVFLLQYLNTMGQWMGNHAPFEMESVMSKIVCGVIVLSLLGTILAGAFNSAVASMIVEALDFQGSSFVVMVLMLVGIFCWGEVTRED